ncbi:MAG: hypothetical protein ACLSVD_00160 [Eggerthellaceae bacterium]
MSGALIWSGRAPAAAPPSPAVPLPTHCRASSTRAAPRACRKSRTHPRSRPRGARRHHGFQRHRRRSRQRGAHPVPAGAPRRPQLVTIAFAAGATLVICEAFNAEQILHFIEFYRVTYMILLPPTTYLRLLRCPTIDQCDLSSVRLVQSAAGATTKPIIQPSTTSSPTRCSTTAGDSRKARRQQPEDHTAMLRPIRPCWRAWGGR